MSVKLGQLYPHALFHELQAVPIPTCKMFCENHCCQREYLPLIMAWASSLHKQQGSTVGPMPPDKPPNPCECLVMNLGTLQFEKTCPGLAYVAVSRANTMGRGDIKKSAIYFVGNDFTNERLTNMTMLKDGSRKTLKVKRRTNWIKHLHRDVHGDNLRQEWRDYIIRWSTTYVVDRDWFERKVLYRQKVLSSVA